MIGVAGVGEGREGVREDHVISGPMRGITKTDPMAHTDTQTDMTVSAK